MKTMTFVSLVGLLEYKVVLLPPTYMCIFFIYFFLNKHGVQVFVCMKYCMIAEYTFIHVMFSVELFCTQCVE